MLSICARLPVGPHLQFVKLAFSWHSFEMRCISSILGSCLLFRSVFHPDQHQLACLQLFIDDASPSPSPEAAAPAGATGEPTLSVPVADADASTSAAPRSLGSLPLRQQMALDAAAGQNNATGSGGMQYQPSTIMESDAASLYRELSGIWHNIKLVCNPFLKRDDVTAKLQHWDLWGPLVRPFPCRASN